MTNSPEATEAPFAHASRAATANGVTFESMVVLQDTNNVVVLLEPSAIVAKVGRWSHSRTDILLEHQVSGWLAERSAPVGEPFGVPHTEPGTDLVTTLWHQLRQDEHSDATGTDFAATLRQVHVALTNAPFDLPDYRVGIDLAAQTLFDDDATGAVAAADLALLRTSFDDLRPVADVPNSSLRPIHGEPHELNFMSTTDGLKLIDFETVCAGPVEWDLASLPGDAANWFDNIDGELLTDLRLLNNVRITTWCLTSPSPQLQSYGRVGIELLQAARRP